MTRYYDTIIIIEEEPFLENDIIVRWDREIKYLVILHPPQRDYVNDVFNLPNFPDANRGHDENFTFNIGLFSMAMSIRDWKSSDVF